ncbi:hypothetical protein MLD38_020903 [Melastoma candidum]|uniref:Uncharacterized protein n=1 Tax=Melastoma candidum TaxID=119954 RepID=A0ACB9QFP6_9MYRT|nr:hypothetical protein MLD38_020903 [Melastoma candidum]
MLAYPTIEAAESSLGRNLTLPERLWFAYSADKSDYFLYCHNILFLFVIFSLVPLPYVFAELRRIPVFDRHKIQPKFRLSLQEMFRCYWDVMRLFFLVVGPLQLVSYPTVKFIGIRTGLPLPSGWEILMQLAVYFLVEDYTNYWIHRFLHSIVPGHIITFWLWIALRQIEAIETHSGYDLPWTPTKYIPFYGGAEYHDYHHYVGGQSQSNFASVFTYCDYIYGTDKGYQYHKKVLGKLKEEQKRAAQLNGGKRD